MTQLSKLSTPNALPPSSLLHHHPVLFFFHSLEHHLKLVCLLSYSLQIIKLLGAKKLSEFFIVNFLGTQILIESQGGGGVRMHS